MRACTTRYANKIENDVSMIFPITLRAEYLNSFCNHLKGYVHHKRGSRPSRMALALSHTPCLPAE
jgi:hypothetical protein